MAPKVIAALEKAKREFDVIGLRSNPHAVLQGTQGYSLGALGYFVEGEKLCEKALSCAHETNRLFSIGVAEMHFGVLKACRDKP